MNDISTLYAEHYPKVVRFLKQLVGEAEAEDAAQETFVKIGRALESFRGDSSLSTWIYRIATNTALDHLRKPDSRLVPLEEDESADDETVPVDASPLHDTLLIRKGMHACIRGIVGELPGEYRTVLVLAEFEGLTGAEIADVLGISLDAAKIRLHRARTKLRKKLEAKCTFYRDERNELSCAPKGAPVRSLKK
jgi:RNA polymerase sigma-70 factor, ECF subfamily